MGTRTIIDIICVLCLVFMLTITFNALSRHCEIRDNNGIIHYGNCMEINRFG